MSAVAARRSGVNIAAFKRGIDAAGARRHFSLQHMGRGIRRISGNVRN
jgi:hypothetical protein